MFNINQFIRAVCPFKPAKLVVLNLSEKGLALLTRDLRSTYGMYVPEDFRTYALNYGDSTKKKLKKLFLGLLNDIQVGKKHLK